MAGFKPGFVTGANAKIKIGSKTMAFCQDVSYSVDVAVIPIESMGKYETHSYEPTAYTINGTFSVIRYTKNATSNPAGGVIKDAADGKGNSPTEMDFNNHLNPAAMLASSTFDIEIIEKRDGTAGANDQSVYKIQDCRVIRRSMSLNKRGVMTDAYQFMGILGGDSDVTNSIGPSGTEDLGT